ncbi:MAG: tyrosine-type recombinase/integrase [Actinomycetota bacterium]|nr:tyrosine-type recombinase/integrase [Actinomycetota bacterium]
MAKTARRQRGDGSLYQRANGLWVGTLDLGIDGRGKRRRWSGTSKTQAGALEKLRAAIREKDKTGAVGPRRLTVGGWLDEWLAHIARPNVRPKTYAEYERCVRLHLKPRLGKALLWNLQPAQVRKALAAVAAEQTAATARNSHRVLRTALQAAAKDGLVTQNAASLVDPPKALSAPRGTLTAAQAKAIVQQSAGSPLGSRWAFALYTGARQGETLGLEWDRVSLADGTADISWQLQRLAYDHGCGPKAGDAWPCGRQRGGNCPAKQLVAPADFQVRPIVGSALVLTRPKTSAGRRIVPLAPVLVEAMRDHRKSGLTTGLVWRDGDGPIDPKDDYAAWQAALAAAGIRPLPLHSARHTTATLLLEAGVDAKVIQELLGHTDVATSRGYQHVDLTLAREAMDRLGRTLA